MVLIKEGGKDEKHGDSSYEDNMNDEKHGCECVMINVIGDETGSYPCAQLGATS
jgi:hypothetical protein